MLRQLYEEVQEPMMDAMQSMNQQPSSSFTQQTPNQAQPTAPNNSALPNPWAAGTSGANNMANPFAGLSGMPGAMPGMPFPGTGAGGMPGMNPADINAMMSNPMYQQMYQQMMSDPNTLQQVLILDIQVDHYNDLTLLTMPHMISCLDGRHESTDCSYASKSTNAGDA